MGLRLRATGVLVVLAGYFVLGFAMIAAIAVLDVFIATHHGGGYGAAFRGAVIVATVVVALGILRGMYVFVRAGRLGPPPRAPRITPEAQPELWALVHAVAGAVGERAPDELYLDFRANAWVKEHRRMLGLLPGRRRMTLGAPLVASLTVPQLRAVVAHELGHFRTRLGGLAMRGRVAMEHTAEIFTGNLTWFDRGAYLVYARYADFYLRRSQPFARAQELAADQAAVHHAGPAATAAALRALPVLDVASTRYLDAYATMGAPVGALPPEGEFYAGYLGFLVARPADRLAALAEGQRPRLPHKYDSHPPLVDRLAAIERTPRAAASDTAPDRETDREPDRSVEQPAVEEPALALLREPAGLLAELERLALTEESAGLTRMSWDDLVLARARHDAESWSRPLQQTVLRARGVPAADARLPDLEAVLDAFDEGLLWTKITPRLPKPDSAGYLTGEAARNFARPLLFDGLAGLVHLRLLDAGEATADIAWATAPGLTLPQDWESGMDAALDAATEDTPDTAPLRALLAATAPQRLEA